jgi:hypothetical protein
LSLLLGCDFSSAPSKRKAIVVAWGRLVGSTVCVDHLQRLATLDAFSEMLQRDIAWVGGFDLPFGLPRELVAALNWPLDWEPCIRHYATLDRAQIRDQFAGFCLSRPAGGKFAHRVTDGPAGSSPSMKWVNPPVAFMLHAGVPRMLNAGVYFPGLQPDPSPNLSPAKVALEAYPGLLAREVLGHRSYKSDDRHNQTPERLIARKDLLTTLQAGRTRLQLRLKLSHAQHDTLADDASGDSLDAVLCLMQSAWAWSQHCSGALKFGLPLSMDPLEGWIITANEVSATSQALRGNTVS